MQGKIFNSQAETSNLDQDKFDQSLFKEHLNDAAFNLMEGEATAEMLLEFQGKKFEVKSLTDQSGVDDEGSSEAGLLAEEEIDQMLGLEEDGMSYHCSPGLKDHYKKISEPVNEDEFNRSKQEK